MPAGNCCAAICLFLFIHRRLNENIAFESVPMSSKIDLEVLAEKVKKEFKIANVEMDKNLNVIIAYEDFSGLGNAEKITLIVDEYSILINSRPTQGSRRLPITIMDDSANIKMLKKIINSL